jgi:signal peptidase I
MQHDDHSPDAGDSPVAPPLERRQDEAAAFDASGMLSTGRWMWEWIKVLSVTIVFILGVRAFVVEAFKIPTGSMENTLLVGDFLLVNKAVYGAEIPIAGARLPAFTAPTRGDVVVFFPPHAPDKNFVKRIVGMPGDTLEMRGKALYRNGAREDEPYVRHLDPVTDPGDPRMAWQRDYLADSWARVGGIPPDAGQLGAAGRPAGALLRTGRQPRFLRGLPPLGVRRRGVGPRTADVRVLFVSAGPDPPLLLADRHSLGSHRRRDPLVGYDSGSPGRT